MAGILHSKCPEKPNGVVVNGRSIISCLFRCYNTLTNFYCMGSEIRLNLFPTDGLRWVPFLVPAWSS